jgi:hypothetical protein
LPVALLFLAWILGWHRLCGWFGFPLSPPRDFRTVTIRVLAPLLIVLLLTAAGMGYYFWRVTGNPVKMPYLVEAEQYGITPLFLWQNLRPTPHYNNDTLEYFYTGFATVRTGELKRFAHYWCFYLGPALTLPLGMVWAALRDRKMRFFLLLSGFVVLALAIEWWNNTHYAAPATVVFYAVLLQGLRHMRVAFWRRNFRSRWRGLVTLVPVAVLAMIAVRFAMPALSIPVKPRWPFTWSVSRDSTTPRALVEQFLRGKPGKHLVFIRYVNHNNDTAIHHEWIYNSANIDQQAIVWARELDEEHNRKLREYFPGRTVWVCSPDERTIFRWE